MELLTKPISELTDDVRRGRTSCVALVTASLEAVRTKGKEVNAFICQANEAALKRAQALDALSLQEKNSLPLLGIPIAIKDNICTRDMPTTCASRMLQNFIPPYNATVVDELTRAGAVIVGKTNLDEFAMGSSTESSVFGPTRNPHNPAYVPGGSSGGSAAAVAAQCVPVALGSDTGGSIRQPASHCGVIGCKPTYGRVSRYGLVAFASSLDQIGPFAHHAGDIGALLAVLSKPDARDSTNAHREFVNAPDLYTAGCKGLRIGMPSQYFGEGLDASVRAAVENVVERCRQAGAAIVEVALPNVKYAIAVYYIVCTAEASSNLARYDGVKYGYRAPNPSDLLDLYERTRDQGFGREVKRRIMLGTYVLSSGYYDAYYLKAAKVRTRIAHDFSEAFKTCDALISPVTPSPAFALGEKTADPLQMYLTDIYTVSANLAGIPGISVPCAEKNGLPIGVQFMAPPWREDTLIKLAHFVTTTKAQ